MLDVTTKLKLFYSFANTKCAEFKVKIVIMFIYGMNIQISCLIFKKDPKKFKFSFELLCRFSDHEKNICDSHLKD